MYILKVVVYLDESGDLGWTLGRPYRDGGSSRFLTIGALLVTSSKKYLPKRLIKNLYEQCRWSSSTEKKWSDMNNSERQCFAKKAKNLKQRYAQDIKYLTITVKKENVESHIRNDANKLYNYMIGLLLTKEMAKYDQVTLVPDPRSIKVESGNSLHDYLQTLLWLHRNAKTVLSTQPCDSQNSRNIQFADMLSGLVQAHMEDQRSPPWDILKKYIKVKRLFFGS